MPHSLFLYFAFDFNLHKTPALVLVLCERRCSLTLTTVPVLGQTNSPFQRWKSVAFFLKKTLLSFISKCDTVLPNTLGTFVSVVPGRFPAAQQCCVNLFSIPRHTHTRTHAGVKVTVGSRAPKLRRPGQIGSKRLIYSEPSWMDCAMTV